MKNSGQVAAFVALLLATVAAHSAQGLVSAYDVEPVKAAWSGWSRGGFVSQLVTCNFDSLSYVELFAGDSGVSNEYTATVFEDGIRVMQSVGQQRDNCSWVRFDNWDEHPAFTKGKVLEFKFTRSGSDSINYYYSETGSGGPYAYGEMLVGGQARPDRDLCARVSRSAEMHSAA